MNLSPMQAREPFSSKYNIAIKRVYIASLLHAKNGEVYSQKYGLWFQNFISIIFRIINECKAKPKNNPVKAMESDFVIAMYPKAILQLIRERNVKCQEEGFGAPYSKVQLYFPYARKSIFDVIGMFSLFRILSHLFY